MESTDTLNLALLQTQLVWEDKAANFAAIDRWLAKLGEGTDLVVLPEMFTTGFTMHAPAMAEDMEGGTVAWMRSRSAEYGLAICGSFIAVDEGKYLNRFCLVDRGEVTAVYDKKHRFRMAMEHEVFSSGHHSPEIELGGWKIMPRVCYDLRFPVWNRSTAIDLQIYVACWPSARVDAWDKLLMARAIENQCYVVGVNRLGTDGNGIAYSGHSVVLDPKGQALTAVNNEAEGWIRAKIDLGSLNSFRKNFPVGLDADRFRILD